MIDLAVAGHVTILKPSTVLTHTLKRKVCEFLLLVFLRRVHQVELDLWPRIAVKKNETRRLCICYVAKLMKFYEFDVEG